MDCNNKKSCLMVATTAAMLVEFNISNLERLQEMGVSVSVACNFTRGNTCPPEKIEAFKAYLTGRNIPYYEMDFPRTPFSMDIFRACGQLRRLLAESHFDLIHTHTPNASALCRLLGQGIRKNGGKLVYTAHGFYFFKGSSFLSWLLFYPIEKHLSRRTDMLISINNNDYKIARELMHAKETRYIPGVGVDTVYFSSFDGNRGAKRLSLGLGEGDVAVLSVGELSTRKNHQAIIRALGKLKRDTIHYFIAGQGETASHLTQLAKEQGVQLHLLGYCDEMASLYAIADIFCFPSLREGLGLAAIEAMAAGVPIITSNVQGIVDYSQDGITGYVCDPGDIDGFATAIASLADDPARRKVIGAHNKIAAKSFDQRIIDRHMERIYGELFAQSPTGDSDCSDI